MPKTLKRLAIPVLLAVIGIAFGAAGFITNSPAMLMPAFIFVIIGGFEIGWRIPGICEQRKKYHEIAK